MFRNKRFPKFTSAMKPFLATGLLDNSQQRTKTTGGQTEGSDTPFNYCTFPTAALADNPLMACADNLKNHTTPELPAVVDDFFTNGITVFGPNPFWAVLNCPALISEGHFEGYSIDLIYGTLNYIATGKRTIGLSLFEELMNVEAGGYRTMGRQYIPQRLNIKPNFDSIIGMDSANLFNLWVSREGGWRDVIYAKQLLISDRWT